MALKLQVAWLLASLHFDDAALDDVVYVSVADGAILALSVINRTEDGLDFFGL